MKLIKHKNYKGYLIKQIRRKYLRKGKKEEWERFSRWMEGQTGALYKGDLVVYKHDYDRFLAGARPMII